MVRRLPSFERLLPVAAVAVALGWAVYRADLLFDLRSQYLRDGLFTYAASLFYGLPDARVTYSMPVTGVILTLLRRMTVTGQQAWLLAAELLPLPLAFLAGAALEGPAVGWLSVLLTIAVAPVLPGEKESSLETLIYACALLLIGRALIDFARYDDRRSRWLLGAAFAIAILIRSPVAYFAPVLLAYLLARHGARGGLLRGAPVVAVPALLLLPWLAINWRMYGHLVFFEYGRADVDLVTAALGFVHNPPAGHTQALQYAQLHEGESILRWVLLRILQHPVTYFWAVPQRLFYLLRQQPLLVAAAAAAFWRRREREDYRLIALLIASFIGVHSLVAVESRYAVPIWPLAAVVAASLGTLAVEARPRAWRAAWPLAASPLAVAAMSAVALAAAYPSRAASAAVDFTQILRLHPSEAVLWHEAGLRAAPKGGPCAAAPAFEKAVRLEPSEEFLRDYARAALRSAGGRYFLVWPGSPLPSLAFGTHRLNGPFLLANADFAQALMLHSAGQDGRARAHFATFTRVWEQDGCRAGPLPPMEALPLADFRGLYAQAKPDIDRWSAGWPAAARRSFARRLRSFGCR